MVIALATFFLAPGAFATADGRPPRFVRPKRRVFVTYPTLSPNALPGTPKEDAMNPKHATEATRPQLPSIDLAVPRTFQTASFAFG